jgi:hypothetical protein
MIIATKHRKQGNQNSTRNAHTYKNKPYQHQAYDEPPTHSLSYPTQSTKMHKDQSQQLQTAKLQQGIGEKSFCIIVVFVNSKTEKNKR